MKPAVAILLGLIPAALHAAAVYFIGFRYTGIIAIFLMLLTRLLHLKKLKPPNRQARKNRPRPTFPFTVMCAINKPLAPSPTRNVCR